MNYSRAEAEKADPRGSLAQLVEQRLEEPCVPSSSLGGATKDSTSRSRGVFSIVARFNSLIVLKASVFRLYWLLGCVVK